MPPTNQQLADRRMNVDVFLSQVSIGVKADQELIGDQLVPVLLQDLSSALIAKHGSEGWLLIEDALGDWSEPKRIDIALDKMRVEVEGHALATVVSARHQNESMKGPARFDLKRGAVYTLKQNMLLNREVGQATLIQNAALYGSNTRALAGNERFDAATPDDPIDLMLGYADETIPGLIGRKPNVAWFGQQAWSKFIINAKVKARIFGTINPQIKPVTPAIVAELLGVEKVLVGRAKSKTAAGVATNVWGKNAGLVYVPPVTGEQIPAFGYTVEQRMFNGSSEAVDQEFDRKMGPAGGWWIKRAHFYTPSLTYTDAGFLFTTVVS